MSFVIETAKVVELVHQAFEVAKQLPDEQREELERCANAALSAAAVYLRMPKPHVQAKHYYAVQALQQRMGNG